MKGGEALLPSGRSRSMRTGNGRNLASRYKQANVGYVSFQYMQTIYAVYIALKRSIILHTVTIPGDSYGERSIPT